MIFGAPIRGRPRPPHLRNQLGQERDEERGQVALGRHAPPRRKRSARSCSASASATVGRVIAALRANGQDEQSAARAAFELVAKKRDASPVESRVWGDRNTLPAN